MTVEPRHAPIPVYFLRLDDARQADPLERVVPTSWRYLVVPGEEARVAHLNTDKGEPKCSGLLHGPVSRALLRACELAEKEVGAQETVYEPRVIDAPALQFLALWMHGPAEPYVPLLDGDDRLRLDKDLGARIRSAVEQWRNRAGIIDG